MPTKNNLSSIQPCIDFPGVCYEELVPIFSISWAVFVLLYLFQLQGTEHLFLVLLRFYSVFSSFTNNVQVHKHISTSHMFSSCFVDKYFLAISCPSIMVRKDCHPSGPGSISGLGEWSLYRHICIQIDCMMCESE